MFVLQVSADKTHNDTIVVLQREVTCNYRHSMFDIVVSSELIFCTFACVYFVQSSVGKQNRLHMVERHKHNF